MNSRFKTIAVTALATTLFWITVIALVFRFGGKQDDRIRAQFLTEAGSFGLFDSTNTKPHTVTLLIEELPTNASATGSVALVRRELAPGQRLRIGYREVMEKSQ